MTSERMPVSSPRKDNSSFLNSKEMRRPLWRQKMGATHLAQKVIINHIPFDDESDMSLGNAFYFAAGIGFLALAKAKNILQGYSTPKPFDISESARCIEYDLNVVRLWLSHLEKYTQGSNSLVGKNVLELGPGSDMGIGIYLLANGCSCYNAFDVNDLMRSTPDGFYEQFFAKLKSLNIQADIDALQEELNRHKTGINSRLNYVVRKDFDIVSALGKSTMDIVFSQAAFEHFDDIESTISQLSNVCKPGALLIAEIDLQTHSRWIRVKDPNNIYRYPDWLYNLFWFRGIPNRIRPHQYREACERSGWTDVKIIPLSTLNDRKGGYSGLSKRFASGINQMDYLSFMLCARKS